MGISFARKSLSDRQRSMSLSEIMTILVSFHRESYRNFKHFYQKQVCRY
nr:hypothetical protein [Halomicronema sp. CCY15110]